MVYQSLHRACAGFLILLLAATSAQAQEVHAFIRSILRDMADDTVAQSVRIQYGGSVKGSNAKELFGQPDIDGGLIGGAALEARSVMDLIKAAAAIK